jgi:membrane protein required for colicin V production
MVGWVDIVLVVILLGTFIAGLVRGLVKEIVGIIAAIIAFLAAASYHAPVAAFLGKSFIGPGAAKFLGFGLVFVAVILIGVVAAELLSKLMAGPLKFVNHLFGGIFGFFEGMLICGAVVFALMVFPVSKEALTSSRLAPYCYGLTKTMVGFIPRELKEQFASAYQELVTRDAGKSESADGKKK